MLFIFIWIFFYFYLIGPNKVIKSVSQYLSLCHYETIRLWGKAACCAQNPNAVVLLDYALFICVLNPHHGLYNKFLICQVAPSGGCFGTRSHGWTQLEKEWDAVNRMRGTYTCILIFFKVRRKLWHFNHSNLHYLLPIIGVIQYDYNKYDASLLISLN